MTGAEIEVVLLSLRVAGVAVLGALPVALGLAWLLARRRFPGHGLLNAVVHLPLILPPVVTGYLLLLAFRPDGPLGALGGALAFRWTGAALAAGLMALPLMVRAIRLALEAADPGLEEMAGTLASPLRVLATVTVPLALPGVLAGAVLGYAKAMGEFGATITFVSNIPGETRTLSLAVWSLLQAPGGEAAAWRLVGLSVALSLGALLASEWLARRVRR